MEVEAGGYMRRDFKDLSPESKETAREDGVLEARTARWRECQEARKSQQIMRYQVLQRLDEKDDTNEGP